MNSLETLASEYSMGKADIGFALGIPGTLIENGLANFQFNAPMEVLLRAQIEAYGWVRLPILAQTPSHIGREPLSDDFWYRHRHPIELYESSRP